MVLLAIRAAAQNGMRRRFPAGVKESSTVAVAFGRRRLERLVILPGGGSADRVGRLARPLGRVVYRRVHRLAGLLVAAFPPFIRSTDGFIGIPSCRKSARSQREDADSLQRYLRGARRRRGVRIDKGRVLVTSAMP